MKFARIKDNKVIEVIRFNPAGKFHPSIRWTQVPEELCQGWAMVDGVWVAPEVPEVVEVVEPVPVIKILTPIEFKMCFTSPERIGIYALRDAGDAILADWLSIIDDPRCTGVDLSLQSTQDAVGYLTTILDGFTAGRAASVLAGEIF